jgi:hypothetical protein
MRLRTALVLAAACMLLMLGCSRPSPFAFRDATPETLEILEAGKPVLAYNHGMILKEGVEERYRRSSYLHPLYAPDGTVLTDDFPKDHYHHRGAAWAWPIVTFLGETHDVWAVQGMHQRFVRWVDRSTATDRAVLAVENGWFVGDRKAVAETVELTVHPAQDNRRHIDVVLRFEAVDEPVKLAGREQKGYGGFGIRFAPRTDTVIRTDAGIEEKDSDMVPHTWAELEATFEGRRAGLRIEDDPANPGAGPVGWCLRHYGYLAANYPGLSEITLEPGKPLVLRYRLTVFSAT